MASYLLAKHPELLLGGDTLGPASYRRCQTFWERYRNTQPDHSVYKRFGMEELKRVIPLCMHGDKGRTLKKSPIAVFSFEAVWGLPEALRDCAVEPGMKKKNEKYEYGHLLGQTCPERRASLSVSRPALDPYGACPCTIDLRRQGASLEEVQTHNTSGSLHLDLGPGLTVNLCYIVFYMIYRLVRVENNIVQTVGRLSKLFCFVLGTPSLGRLQIAPAAYPHMYKMYTCSSDYPQYANIYIIVFIWGLYKPLKLSWSSFEPHKKTHVLILYKYHIYICHILYIIY